MPAPAQVIIEHPGTLTTVQDLGRPGLRAAGLPVGGAIDALALRIANLLVGNEENAAALECALVGPTLRFTTSATLAIAGARVDGLPYAARFRVRAGESLRLSKIVLGVYAYLAIGGGISVPFVLQSRATDVRLGYGGFNGRPLRPGDELTIGKFRQRGRVDCRANVAGWYDADEPIQIVDGKDAALVDPTWLTKLFRVSSKSDRVGVRLHGERVTCANPSQAASSAVFPGTVQLPGDGLPIVLLADAQTLGGYPQIGHVIRIDLPRMAQLRPGAAVRFARVSLAEAHRLAIQRERELAFLRYGIGLTMKP